MERRARLAAMIATGIVAPHTQREPRDVGPRGCAPHGPPHGCAGQLGPALEDSAHWICPQPPLLGSRGQEIKSRSGGGGMVCETFFNMWYPTLEFLL